MHFPRDGEPYIVMMIKENELDQRVLARLFEADQAKGDPMAKLNAANKAAQVMQEYRRSQEMEGLAEVHAALLKSPLHTYRHNGKKYELWLFRILLVRFPRSSPTLSDSAAMSPVFR